MGRPDPKNPGFSLLILPPSFWRVSRPPGAAQTPKIDDFRSVKKSHQNPKYKPCSPRHGKDWALVALQKLSGEPIPGAQPSRGAARTKESRSLSRGFWIWLNIGRFRGLGGPAGFKTIQKGGLNLFGWFENTPGPPRPRKRLIFSQIPNALVLNPPVATAESGNQNILTGATTLFAAPQAGTGPS